ncbi:MAG: ferritin family protein [candidate division WOR-3 bacterium]|nr:ferritin family protein [candidate division WOR-3 bacterium]MDW8113507.1 ferritin family protein [candidate division WOR-3 bacterium]
MNEIFQLAINLEKEALISYLRFAQQIAELAGKNLFIRLAMDEFEHIEILEKEQKYFEKEKSFKDVEIPKTEIEKTLPYLKPSLPKKRKVSDLNELNILQMALELEKKAIEFYQNQVKESQDEIIKKIWQRLKEIEEGHYKLIQAEIDSLTKTGFWFDFREFSLEEY